MKLLTVNCYCAQLSFRDESAKWLLTVKSSVPESQSPRPHPTFSHSPDGLLWEFEPNKIMA